ncbi:phage major capsid protein [Nocardia terpenica]|uniref:phage major capsid protein n=1 Tax=Nocardia terpenica TaxID=455432 RepID=UPI002B4AEFAC|nr:phage major capsid protein [Nocardia terpenica]
MNRGSSLAATAVGATTFAGVDAKGLVPKPLASEIMARVQEQSVVRRLAGKTAMPLEGTAIAVQTGHVQAGVVGEGTKKPVSKTDYTTKTIRPIKVAALTYFSKELRLRNPLGVLENIADDMVGAITRAFDLAVLHGTNPVTGPISGVESVNQTGQRVKLGTTAKADGGLSTDFANGHALVEDNWDFGEFSGFAADKRLKTKLMTATDVQGRPIYQDAVNLRNGFASLLGYDVAYSKAVSGRYIGGGTDNKVRALGGDWSSLKYGFSEELTISRSDQASIDDNGTTVYLWQQNLEAYLVEAIFGWVIPDLKAFVAYDEAAAE